MKKTLIPWCWFLIVSFASLPAFSQTDSCNLQISLLTGTPGEELYSTFGHSAIRIIDSSSRQDLVFNYGTFEFNDEFYPKFVRGKLNYYLSVSTFDEFASEFQFERRSIIEQSLLLTCAEKHKLVAALQENLAPQNRTYKYDFLFDNCATRIRDIVRKNTDQPVTYNNMLSAEAPTFRDLLHSYLNRSGQFWSKLGIDILLGSKVDRIVTNEEAMFLPDYLLKGFDSATIGTRRLADSPKFILNNPAPENKAPWFTPLVLISALLLLVILAQLSRNKTLLMILSAFDYLFFFLLGVLGVLILFMWFGTDHVVCRNNLNLLWALPTHLIILFVMGRKKKWVKKYFQVVLVLSALLGILWWFLPQEFNTATAPVIAIIIARSYYRSKYY